jgi:LuxR family maltose regulon positive regulatory protein
MAGLYRAGHVADTFGCAIALADIRITQGRLGAAMQIYREALRRADRPGQAPLRGTSDMYVGMSEVELERAEIPGAAKLLLQAVELGEPSGLPQNPYRRRVAMAMAAQAQGNLLGALDLINEAERCYVSDFFPNVRQVSAIRARLLAAQGRFDDAIGWTRERALSTDDDLNYLREFDHITFAKVLLIRDAAAPAAPDQAGTAGLLDRLLRAADAGGRTGSVIEILVLQAICRHLSGNHIGALAALEHALTLAEPEGYVRVFSTAGRPMAALLNAATKRGIHPGYVRRLRAALETTLTHNHSGPLEPAGQQGLIGPLSARELDVLRLLGTDLDGPDIARQLVVSLNTVRSHTKNIYAKLGVSNRRAAVSRGRELDLMARPDRPRPTRLR